MKLDRDNGWVNLDEYGPDNVCPFTTGDRQEILQNVDQDTSMTMMRGIAELLIREGIFTEQQEIYCQLSKYMGSQVVTLVDVERAIDSGE